MVRRGLDEQERGHPGQHDEDEDAGPGGGAGEDAVAGLDDGFGRGRRWRRRGGGPRTS